MVETARQTGKKFCKPCLHSIVGVSLGIFNNKYDLTRLNGLTLPNGDKVRGAYSDIDDVVGHEKRFRNALKV